MSNVHPTTEPSDKQRSLLARLVRQGKLSIDQLHKDGVGRMNREGVNEYITNVLDQTPSAEEQREVDQLFGK